MPKVKMLNQFIGREKDLEFLENSYKKTQDNAQLVILTGKIRVGKTRLLKTFYEKKPHIYFNCNYGSALDQLETAVEFFTKEFEDTYLDKKSIPDWKKFFEYLNSKLKKVKVPLIIIFDEFQNLIESDPGIVASFNTGWEEQLKNKKILLILSGSDTNLMNKHVLNHKSAIFKKKTAQWNVQNFDFKTTKKCFVGQDFEKIFSLYSVIGGVPAYIHETNSKLSFKENILKTFLDKSSYLSVEAQLLISEEFDTPQIYLTVLKAIGLGGVKYSDIISKTGLNSSKLSVYLNNLIKIGLIKRALPITIINPEKSKKGLYFITDYFLRFYFSFIFPHKTLIESGNLEALYKNHSDIITKLIALAYAETSIDFIQDAVDKQLIPSFENLGSWWNNEDQISAVGYNQNDNQIIFVDTFWKNKVIGMPELNQLKAKSKLVDWKNQDRTEYFGLVSNKGFTQELINYSKQESIYLFKEDHLL